MTRAEVYEKLRNIFFDVFDDEEIKIEDTTTSNDIEGWDSMRHIILIGVIEDEFGIKFNMEVFPRMKNVGIMVDMIQEKL